MRTFSITQKKFPGRRQLIEVDGNDIRVTLSGPSRNENWTIPVLSLDCNPTRVRRRPIIPWFLALLLLAVLLAFLLVAFLSMHDNQSFGGELIFAFVFAVLALQRLAKAFESSVNITVFPSYGGRALVLWFENPNKQLFHQFVETLAATIAHERENYIAPNGSISAELKQLRVLHEQGILDAEQFRAAVNKIVETRDRDL